MAVEACPPVTSIRDLDCVSEIYDPETGTVSRTTFYTSAPNDTLYAGEVAKPRDAIALPELQAALHHVPDEDVFPPVPEGEHLTIAPLLYTKQPTVSLYDTVQDTDYLFRLLLKDAHIMERISQDPHPNIVRYHGIRVRRGRVTGLVLDRHERTLLSHLEAGLELANTPFMRALEAAVDHLHSLGLAHNDINPENIMVNKRWQPVLIDFGSCRPFGERLMTAGTPGWTDEKDDRPMWSEQKHDFFALDRVRDWLKNPTFE